MSSKPYNELQNLQWAPKLTMSSKAYNELQTIYWALNLTMSSKSHNDLHIILQKALNFTMSSKPKTSSPSLMLLASTSPASLSTWFTWSVADCDFLIAPKPHLKPPFEELAVSLSLLSPVPYAFYKCIHTYIVCL